MDFFYWCNSDIYYFTKPETVDELKEEILRQCLAVPNEMLRMLAVFNFTIVKDGLKFVLHINCHIESISLNIEERVNGSVVRVDTKVRANVIGKT